MFPEMLSHLQQEFKSYHAKLYHLHPKYMFRLEKLGVLPSILLELKDDVPLCESCMFLREKIRKRKTKGNKLGSIRK